MERKKKELDSLEGEKERMIRRYMELQDKVDAVNEDIYRTCCDIETLNARISIVRDEIRRAMLPPTPNGKAQVPHPQDSASRPSPPG